MFKWICYFTGLILGCVIVGLLALLSMKAGTALTQSNEALATVNESLPEIVGETKKTTDTLAMLAEDVNDLKRLAGVQSDAREKSLVGYAASVIDLLEQETAGKDARVGVSKRLGSGLKDVESVAEFIVGARREATLLVFRAKSKQEVLRRLAHNWSGRAFYIQFGDEDPVALEDWFRSNHEESKSLPPFPE